MPRPHRVGIELGLIELYAEQGDHKVEVTKVCFTAGSSLDDQLLR